jgi:hypothetical protein
MRRSLRPDERVVFDAALEVYGDRAGESLRRDASGHVLTLSLRDGRAYIVKIATFAKLYREGTSVAAIRTCLHPDPLSLVKKKE